MILNILSANNFEDPSVQLSVSWREAPQHARWSDADYWALVRDRVARRANDDERRRVIVTKEVANEER